MGVLQPLHLGDQGPESSVRGGRVLLTRRFSCDGCPPPRPSPGDESQWLSGMEGGARQRRSPARCSGPSDRRGGEARASVWASPPGARTAGELDLVLRLWNCSSEGGVHCMLKGGWEGESLYICISEL